VTFNSPSSARTAAILNAASKHLRPDPERAAQLRREFSSADGFNGIATRIWPGLRAVRMTATGSFAHHASRLADVYMRNVRQLSLIHAASEGYYGVGLGSKSAAPNSARSAVDGDEMGMRARYAILPTVGFYEFIPVDQLDARQPITLFAEQVIPVCLFIYISVRCTFKPCSSVINLNDILVTLNQQLPIMHYMY